MLNLPPESRYRETEKIVFNNIMTFGSYKPRHGLLNLTTEDLIRIKVQSGFAGRPDLISEQYYQTSAYDWVVVMINSPLNPINWPKQGTFINIVSPGSIDKVVHE